MACVGDKDLGERGSAIVFVLWVSVLLSVILVGTAALVQTQLRMVSSRRDAFVREESLLSALDVVAFDTALVGRTYISSLPRTVEINGRSISVSLAPTHNRLGINMANDEDWISLFTLLGESEAASRRLAEQILDWRDGDTQRRANGAEAEDYLAGGGKEPGNRPFISVGELIQVRDMTAQRLACLAPYLTVFGGTADPVLDGLGAEEAASMEGVRVAYRAEVSRPNGVIAHLTGLARFGSSGRRPFEWVGFVDDGVSSDTCIGDDADSRENGA
jgi:general secretion pathway protein K